MLGLEVYILEENLIIILNLLDFANILEEVCIETVESGIMTKDLAILINAKQKWLNTQDFLNIIDKKI